MGCGVRISIRLSVALAWPLPKGYQLRRWPFIRHPVSNYTAGGIPIRLQCSRPSGTTTLLISQDFDTLTTSVSGDILVSQPLQEPIL